MSKALTILAGLLFLTSFTCVQAQSRRVPPGSNEKPNQRERPIEVEATPTTTPETIQNAAEDSGEIISIDTKLVTVPVRVLDRKNRFIGGLKKDNFTIYEDSVQQDLAYFTNEAQPFTVALVLDMSYSTTFKIDEIQNAAIAFIGQLRPEDQVMVISFDDEVHVLCDATTDRKRINAAIRSTRIQPGTSLYEAVDLTMNTRLRSIKGRKAIVLFTDGVDTTSRASNETDNLRDAMELDALIYPIQYDTYSDVQEMKNRTPAGLPPGLPIPDSSTKIPGQTPSTLPASLPFPFPAPRSRTSGRRNEPRVVRQDDPLGLPPSRPPMTPPGQQGTTSAEYEYADEYLKQLALRTGGRVNLASTYSNLNVAFARIASELREFYSIGYYPQNQSEPGRVRRIKVRVDQENLVVKSRDSYVVAKAGKPAGN